MPVEFSIRCNESATCYSGPLFRGQRIDPFCLRIDGVGRAYKLRRTGPGAVAVQVFEPGQSFSLVD